MARNLENSTSDNSNIQEMGPGGSTKLNMVLGGTAPPPRGSTMSTTAVTTRDEVHGTTIMAQIVPPRQVQAVQHKAHAAEATAQASHSRASRTEQPTPVTKPAPAAQPAPDEQSTHVAQPAPTEQPTWPSLLPPSSPLTWSRLLIRPILLPWPYKQPKSPQDYLNHPG